jgi:uncharacterized membrane protein
MSEGHIPAEGEKETGRVEAFSDGVFAIAITLLVLELKIPRGLSSAGLAVALREEWPSYAAFLCSFGTIGIMWLNHHRLFMLIRRVDRVLLVLNGLLLLGVSVVPFPTALLADYLGHDGDRLAAAVYGGLFVFIALGFNVLWRYAASGARRPRLLRLPHDSPEVRAIHEQYRYGPSTRSRSGSRSGTPSSRSR